MKVLLLRRLRLAGDCGLADGLVGCVLTTHRAPVALDWHGKLGCRAAYPFWLAFGFGPAILDDHW
jgi:hypothetical protein